MYAVVVFLFHVGDVSQQMIVSEVVLAACARKFTLSVVRDPMSSQILARLERPAAMAGVLTRAMGLAIVGAETRLAPEASCTRLANDRTNSFYAISVVSIFTS